VVLPGPDAIAEGPTAAAKLPPAGEHAEVIPAPPTSGENRDVIPAPPTNGENQDVIPAPPTNGENRDVIPASTPAGAAPSATSASDSPGSRRKEGYPNRKRGHDRILALEDDPGDSIDRGRRWLKERGVILGLDVSFLDQWANTVLAGKRNAPSIAWQVFGDWKALETEHFGDLHIAGTLLGTVGLGYDPATAPLSQRVGSISVVDGIVYPDEIALDELYLRWRSPGGAFVVDLGRVDMSFFFDTNRVANNSFEQFISLAFENNLSIPFPTYGGFGVTAQWAPNEDFYVLFGAGDASSVRTSAWRTIVDGAWWELLEVGMSTEIEGWGKGNYRLTGWQSNLGEGSGFGVGLNVDQNLGSDELIGFARLGYGSPAQSSIRLTASVGLSLGRPFDRSRDSAGIAFSWAAPTVGGIKLQDEMLVEVYYRLALTQRLSLSPDVQVVIDPSANPDVDAAVLLGARLTWIP
jgi:hypothetical protein